MKRHTRSPRRRSRWLNTFALLLLPVILVTSVPADAWTVTPAKPAFAQPSASAPRNLRTVSPRSAPRAGANTASPRLGPDFSASPRAEEIRAARVFEEPLIPVGGPTTAKEDKALAQALRAYGQRRNGEDTSAITAFLKQHPHSAWRAALLTNLGIVYRRTGYTARALAAWEEAWRLMQNQNDRSARALADRAAGELADLRAHLGHAERLQALLAELQGRDVTGPATEKIAGAREGLWLMRHRPEEAFRCGPYALSALRAAEQPETSWEQSLRSVRAGAQGTSLTELQALAARWGMSYQMAYRAPGAPLPVPSVVHWKLGHYGALLKEEQGRYLLQDATVDRRYGHQMWISAAALDEEASGYFLLPQDPPRPAGWRAVQAAEGARVWGKGYPSGSNPNANRPYDKKDGGNDCPKGMAQYAVHSMLASLNIADTPVGYTPPRGPAVNFTVTYNQREAGQPALFSYANLGAKWTFNWLSYVTDDPNNPQANASLFLRGGGTEVYSGFNQSTQSYAPQLESRATLVRTGPAAYERRLINGAKEIFNQPNGATTFPRKIFLTQIIDPYGNAAQLTYDDSLRLTTIADALNQVTTLSYDLPADPLKITQVTDPFGRAAKFDYNPSGQLVRITDVVGIASEFAYGPGPFINALTTPYGTTRFAFGEAAAQRWVEITDPLGAKERVEYRVMTPEVVFSEPNPPAGIPIFNSYINGRNSFYWDKRAMQLYPGNYNRAKITHWLHDFDGNVCSAIPESEKSPLENRVWYYYPGQSSPGFLPGTTVTRPSIVARVLDDGTTQRSLFEYNATGKLTKSTDPVGRVMSYIYSADQVDLLEVRQTRGANNELLSKYTYNAQHQPLTHTDASGQTTRFAYNTFGQLLTVTNPRNETVTMTYDDNGYLLTVAGPVAGATLNFTYDAYGRVQTRTDSEGYTLTYSYDDLDRVTQITYPDGSFEQMVYDRLDLGQTIDRLGRTTVRTYNARRQIVSLQDAEGRTTRFEWCQCGGLDKVIDPLGRETSWERDVQGRIARKIFPDGSDVQYTYEGATSRIQEITDARGQVKRYQYNADDSLRQVSYPGARPATPSVMFTYDPDYDRLLAMDDGTGRTTYVYNRVANPPALGAGRLASVTGPLPNSTIAYAYDELGRIVRRAVNGVAESLTYDALNRITQAVNPLGTFNYRYVNATNRLQSVSYPNGQSTQYSYYDNVGDQRLQEIRNLDPSGAVLSKFNYTYDAEGQITSWLQQTDGQPPVGYALEYDGVSQLLSATPFSAGALSYPWSQYLYAYDRAGNRTREQIDDGLTQSGYNDLNQLLSQQASSLPTPDPVARRTEVQYDGRGRRVRVVEKEDGAVVSEKRYLWCGDKLCEERDATGATVTKRFYAQGVQVGGTNYYYTVDHLGSLRELTDGTGAVRARYDYDPYGRRNKVSGDLDADFGYTGHYFHAPSGLHWALYRAYDANMGRWISRDPVGEDGGLNLYAYVENSPVGSVDPEGDIGQIIAGALIGGGIDLVSQLISNGGRFDCVDWGSVGKNALIGGLTAGGLGLAAKGLGWLGEQAILRFGANIPRLGAVREVLSQGGRLTARFNFEFTRVGNTVEQARRNTFLFEGIGKITPTTPYAEIDKLLYISPYGNAATVVREGAIRFTVGAIGPVANGTGTQFAPIVAAGLRELSLFTRVVP